MPKRELLLKRSEAQQKEENDDIPVYKTKLDISGDDQKKVVEEIIAEYDAIKEERKKAHCEDRWDALDKQYEGEMREIEGMQFNISRQTTAIKINAIVRSLMLAFFRGDRVFSITARPEFDAKGGQEVLDAQEDFLDYKVDEDIPLEEVMGKVFHSASLKDGGILKIRYKRTVKKRKIEERFTGDPIPVIDPKTGQPTVDQLGRPVIKNDGLDAFLRVYPEGLVEYPGFVRQLSEGKELDLVAEFDEVTYDDPFPEFVDLKDFFVRMNTNGITGLRDGMLTMERKEYSYWELKQEEKEENLFDVDKLIFDNEDDKKNNKPREKFASMTYELFECVYYAKLSKDKSDQDDGDFTDNVRYVFHISLEKKSMHGAMFYPYYAIDTSYIPFFTTSRKNGFYQPGPGRNMSDLHLAENILLNFVLQGAWTSNVITPIVKKGSNVAKQFLEKRWLHGIPLETDGNEKIDFLNKHFKPFNSIELINLIQYLRQESGDVSGVTEAFASGRVDPIDPSAPAAKTAMLLKQSGINIEDYIERILPSFNEIANVFLQMYFQKSLDTGVKYRQRPDKVVKGGDPFKVMTRADMGAKTNAQSEALAFNFDRSNLKRDNVALFQLIRQEVAPNPRAVYFLVKAVIGSWSYFWKNKIDRIWPTPEEFERQLHATSVQAVATYVEGVLQEAKATGQEPAFDPRQLIAAIGLAGQDMMTPPDEKTLKKREEAIEGEATSA